MHTRLTVDGRVAESPYTEFKNAQNYPQSGEFYAPQTYRYYALCVSVGRVRDSSLKTKGRLELHEFQLLVRAPTALNGISTVCSVLIPYGHRFSVTSLRSAND